MNNHCNARRKPTAVTAALAAALSLTAIQATAQSWPAKPVRMHVPFPPGGSPDIVARLVAPRLAERLGQPVLIDNNTIGGSIGATESLKRAAPDGYTIMMMTGGTPGIAATRKVMPYDLVKDFAYLSTVTGYPVAIAVAANSPIKSLQDLIERARAAPGKLTFSAATPGSLLHLFGEWLSVEAGISTTAVFYKGAMGGFPDVLGGRVDFMAETSTFVFQQVKGGKLRALALSSPARYPQMPDVPTIAETIPGFELSSWLGLATAGATPAPIVNRMSGELRAIVVQPEVRQRFGELGAVPLPSTPEEFRERMDQDIKRWKRVVEIKKIEVE